jgi:hypothetical protein
MGWAGVAIVTPCLTQVRPWAHTPHMCAGRACVQCVYNWDLDWVQSTPTTACIHYNQNRLIKIEQLKFKIRILFVLKN